MQKVANLEKPTIIEMAPHLYDTMPSYEEIVTEAGSWYRDFCGKKGNSDKYVWRSGGWQNKKNCNPWFNEALKWYGFNFISAFVSMEENSQNGLQIHDDDWDVFAFNIFGKTTWWFEDSRHKFYGLDVEGPSMIYMPRGFRHTVEVYGERLSVSFVRKSLRSKPTFNYNSKLNKIKILNRGN